MINQLTNNERYIIIVALSNLDAMLEAPDPAFDTLAKRIRDFLRKHGIHKDDIKDLAVKFGVPEKTVYSAGKGLQ